ncbi:unnamed protein product [Phytophthora lilii]|uniref:Unnamed protein product n=1 Tax=Phytophthora lilii TaxID=2077276 RepID=A0A9W7CUF9_9STRA|nr:unnamed protein product [Phytophthora lilii]
MTKMLSCKTFLRLFAVAVALSDFTADAGRAHFSDFEMVYDVVTPAPTVPVVPCPKCKLSSPALEPANSTPINVAEESTNNAINTNTEFETPDSVSTEFGGQPSTQHDSYPNINRNDNEYTDSFPSDIVTYPSESILPTNDANPKSGGTDDSTPSVHIQTIPSHEISTKRPCLKNKSGSVNGGTGVSVDGEIDGGVHGGAQINGSAGVQVDGGVDGGVGIGVSGHGGLSVGVGVGGNSGLAVGLNLGGGVDAGAGLSGSIGVGLNVGGIHAGLGANAGVNVGAGVGAGDSANAGIGTDTFTKRRLRGNL